MLSNYKGCVGLGDLWLPTSITNTPNILTAGILLRGIRNNNPGNIRLTNDKWQGRSPTQTDGEFVQQQE